MRNKPIINKNEKVCDGSTTGKDMILFVNEFNEILKYYEFLESEATFSDVIVMISDINREFHRIATQFRLFEEKNSDKKKSYFDFQRSKALPLYRKIIKLCLIMADKKRININDAQRQEIISTLMEGMDILITEIDIMNPLGSIETK